MRKRDKKAAQDFEGRMARLQEIVQTLESGKVSLEESLALYQEGVACSAACRQQLDEARNVLTIVQNDGVHPFDALEHLQDDDLSREKGAS